MRVRALSPTGDFQFGNSLQDFLIDEPATVGQIVQTTLLLWEGEWYLDTSLGVPYPESILGKHSQQTADTTIRDTVLNVLGVVDIASYESEINNSGTVPPRAYSVAMTIDTVYGPTEVQIQNYVNF
jgi:hypothetical protein